MKKILYSILAIGILLTIIFTFGKTKNDETISLAEVTHSPFYTPLYVAIENGYFEKEGINLELILTPGADKVSSAVLSGDVDLGFAGAESAIYVYNAGEEDYLQIFSGLTKRDGQFIVSKNKNENFKLTDLYGKEILVGRSTGMPALNFLNALKNEGVDPNKININYSIDFASLSGAFISGTGDYVNLFEPNVLALEKEELGYAVQSIGKLSGSMPYTVFYARKSYIKNNEKIIRGFINAINKAIKFTMENDEEKVAKTIISQFPDTDVNDLARIIKRYKDSDSWLKSNYIEEKYLENLEDIMIDNNLLGKYVPYNDLIVNYE